MLNGEMFGTIDEAKNLVEQWHREYNTIRPHSSLGYRPSVPIGTIPAIGYAVEFSSYAEIIRRYGANGITDMPIPGVVSDDTQMTLFTAEGLLRAICRGTLKGICHIPSLVYDSYLRWYYTQTKEIPTVKDAYNSKDMKQFVVSGNLINDARLYRREAPGDTCLSALSSGYIGKVDKALNNSKGSGGVMRVAPVGLLFSK